MQVIHGIVLGKKTGVAMIALHDARRKVSKVDVDARAAGHPGMLSQAASMARLKSRSKEPWATIYINICFY